jgi:hypothetical protein
LSQADQSTSFSYHNSIAPMMWVFVALGAIELAVVHFLLSFWSPIATLILWAVTLLSLVWMVALIRSFRRWWLSRV